MKDFRDFFVPKFSTEILYYVNNALRIFLQNKKSTGVWAEQDALFPWRSRKAVIALSTSPACQLSSGEPCENAENCQWTRNFTRLRMWQQSLWNILRRLWSAWGSLQNILLDSQEWKFRSRQGLWNVLPNGHCEYYASLRSVSQKICILTNPLLQNTKFSSRLDWWMCVDKLPANEARVKKTWARKYILGNCC
jgi:hypothetical protein